MPGYRKCSGDGDLGAVATQSEFRRTSAGRSVVNTRFLQGGHAQGQRTGPVDPIAFSERAFFEERPAPSVWIYIPAGMVLLPSELP